MTFKDGVLRIKIKDSTFVVDTATWVGTAWVFISGPYMYMAWNPFGLVNQIVTEWKNDKHLIG